MRLVYVIGPYRAATEWGVERNIQNALSFGAYVARMGAYPVIPHANTAHFGGLCPDAFLLEGTLELCSRCDAAFCVPGWSNSEGSCGEVGMMVRLGKPVFEALGNLKEWIESSNRKSNER